MEDFIAFVIEVILEIATSVESNKTPRYIKIGKLKTKSEVDSYIVGLITTAIVVNYEDDHKLDKEEKKLIKQLVKKIPYKLTKTTRKNLRYIKKRKISLNNLKYLYEKLNIDYYMMLKITNDLEHLLRQSKKNSDKKLELVNTIRNQIEDK